MDTSSITARILPVLLLSDSFPFLSKSIYARRAGLLAKSFEHWHRLPMSQSQATSTMSQPKNAAVIAQGLKAELVKKTLAGEKQETITPNGQTLVTQKKPHKGAENLKPIAKGEVRNPKGINGFTHPRAAMVAEAQRLQEKAMKVLAKQLDSDDERIAQAAAKELLDRAHGKPVAPVAEVDSEGNDRPPPPPMVVIGVSAK